MRLEVLTPLQSVFSRDNISCISLHTNAGYISIYPDHEDLISILVPGAVEVEYDSNINILFVLGGILTIDQNKITILSDTIIKEEDIDTNTSVDKITEMQRRLDESDVLSEYEAAKLEGMILMEKIILASNKRKQKRS